ncbi:unnamed protein product, partial [Darwinula stevensoni]
MEVREACRAPPKLEVIRSTELKRRREDKREKMPHFHRGREAERQGNGQQSPAKDGQTSKDFAHNCKNYEKLAELKQLEKFKGKDPREKNWMKVREAAYKNLTFREGAEEYQKENYPGAEMRAYSFPVGYVLKDQSQKKLFDEMQKAKATKEVGASTTIPIECSAVATVFDYMKEELADIPSFVTYDYEFNATFYKAMGVEGKGTPNKEDRWNRYGIEILRSDHDVCGIVSDGNRVLVLFFEVKSRHETKRGRSLLEHMGKAENQLEKGHRVVRQMVGATAFKHTYLCGFVAFPYLSRKDIRESLGCDCDENILTKDDLDSRDSFKNFLERHGVTLTRKMTREEAVKECYLDVMRTYVAASASVSEMPRTVEEFRENIGENMQEALLLLTPHQRQILHEDRRILFLTGGQGTGKTWLLLKRAEELAHGGEEVIIVNMSGGELTNDITKWRDERHFEDKITIKYPGGSNQQNFIETIIADQEKHVLVDEMQINWEMEESEPADIGQRWKDFAEKSKCKSLWIVWCPSNPCYHETLDFQKIIDSLGRERVELLTEIKRNTENLGKFVIDVTRFIQKRFPCSFLLPMQGLENNTFLSMVSSEHKGEMDGKPQIVFIKAPPKYNEVYLWASEAALKIRSLLTDSRPFTIITRGEEHERNVVVRELGGRLQQKVAFLDKEGRLRGHSEPDFFVFHEYQVVGMSFQDLILLDDEKCFYRSWSRIICMARGSLHVITTISLLSGRWEEPQHLGLISSCSLMNPGKPSLDVSHAPLDESHTISWPTSLEQDTPSPDAETEWKRFVLLFGQNQSGKTTFLINRLKGKAEQVKEEMSKEELICKTRILFVDCSRWHRNACSKKLFLVSMEERIKKIGLEKVVEVFDIHELIQDYGFRQELSFYPQAMEKLLVKISEKGEKEGQRFHVALDNAPVHAIGRGPGDTDGLRKEWESILESLSSHTSLASLTIAFLPYVGYVTITFDVKEFKREFKVLPDTRVMILESGYRNAGFPSLLRHVLSHESPHELRVKPGTLNTRPRPSSLVPGEKPYLITPPLEAHYHGGFMCVGGRGRGCLAVAAAAYLHSNLHELICVTEGSKEEKKEEESKNEIGLKE